MESQNEKSSKCVLKPFKMRFQADLRFQIHKTFSAFWYEGKVIEIGKCIMVNLIARHPKSLGKS